MSANNSTNCNNRSFSTASSSSKSSCTMAESLYTTGTANGQSASLPASPSAASTWSATSSLSATTVRSSSSIGVDSTVHRSSIDNGDDCNSNNNNNKRNVNVYTTCGRHSNEWLFSGWSFRR